MQAIKKEKLEMLRREILCLQGLGTRPSSEQPPIKLGPVLNNMPGKVFPVGAVHEFLSPTLAASAATNGFISAVISFLMQSGKPCLWVGMRRTIFPPALKVFGIDPDRIVFIEVAKEKEALWTIEEALKCKALGAVIGEIKELDFTSSRRLQLAVEDSRVTGFINRLYPRSLRPTACVARWQILPAGSQTTGGLPGIGFPRWRVELLKIRNGKPDCWQLEWSDNAFHSIDSSVQKMVSPALQTGVA
jgi:protein ImuA